MKKQLIPLFALALFCASPYIKTSSGVFNGKNGEVSFLSDAKLQNIKAKSTELTGKLDVVKRQFSFSIPICSFQGFFNKTQKRHYCEKYVEGEKFPTAAFKGKIIEDVDLSVPGTYQVRAKGMFLLHGIENETIISSTVTVKENQIAIEAKYKLPITNYNIKVSNSNNMIAKMIDIDTKIIMTPE